MRYYRPITDRPSSSTDRHLYYMYITTACCCMRAQAHTYDAYASFHPSAQHPACSHSLTRTMIAFQPTIQPTKHLFIEQSKTIETWGKTKSKLAQNKTHIQLKSRHIEDATVPALGKDKWAPMLLPMCLFMHISCPCGCSPCIFWHPPLPIQLP